LIPQKYGFIFAAAFGKRQGAKHSGRRFPALKKPSPEGEKMPILSSRAKGAAFGFFALCILAVFLAANAAAAPPPPPPPGPAGPGPAERPGPPPGGPGPAGVYEGYTGPRLGAFEGGYTGPGPALATVKEAMAKPNDSAVSLKGNIINYLGRDDYTFADSTGSVELRIPPPAWQGQSVSEADTVEIQGEIKQERERTVIHVRRIIKK
jgi:uncharacterized protein (TIGR00156 family)